MKQGGKPSVIQRTKLIETLILSGLCISFVVGMLLGCFFAQCIAEEDLLAISDYINSYLTVVRSQQLIPSNLWSVIWDTFRWPILIVFLSFTVIGNIGIPIVFLMRGFLLSFAVSSFILTAKGVGAVLAFLLFGISGFFSLPVLFILGTQGMGTCRGLIGKKQKTQVYQQGYFKNCGVSACVLMVCACLEQTVIPVLLFAAAT